MTYKAVKGLGLKDPLSLCAILPELWSQELPELELPSYKSEGASGPVFSVRVPALWNLLPLHGLK